MRFPFDKYRIGTRYGVKGKYWKSGFHSGLDLISIGSNAVFPIEPGTVYKITTSGSYGKCVYVKHLDGYLSLYAHLNTINVLLGQKVNEYSVLGTEGMSGNATGKHLHLEVHKGVYKYPSNIDPLNFIEKGIKEMQTVDVRIVINGKEKVVKALVKDDQNYIRLRDLQSDKIMIDFVNNKPTVTTK